MQKEKDIENIILVWLNAQPETFAFKIATTGFFDTKRNVFRKNLSRFIIPGTSDILGVSHHRMIAIEVKTPITMRRFLNYPTERDLMQKIFLDKINRLGGVAKCVCSLEEVKQLIKGLMS